MEQSMRRLVLCLFVILALGGCGASTLLSVATAPIRVVSKGIDLATTSQSEADQNRGRDLRKLEERYGRLSREYDKQDRRCGTGDTQACAKRDGIAAQMDEIRPQLPVQAGQ
jgi:hypothetical protein